MPTRFSTTTFYHHAALLSLLASSGIPQATAERSFGEPAARNALRHCRAVRGFLMRW